MIVFEGTQSETIIEKTREQLRKIIRKLYLISIIILMIPTICLVLCFDNLLNKIIAISVYLGSVIVIALIILLFNREDKILNGFLVLKTVFLDGMILTTSVKNQKSYKISNVKKIVDYGDSYGIIFYHQIINIFCQKDLLTEGTIEEFEELFEGKIIKSNTEK